MSTLRLAAASLLILSAPAFMTGAGGQEPSPPATFTYEEQRVVLDSAERQTVLTGFLLGGAVANLAVIHLDANDRSRLRIYAFEDGAWGPAPALDTTLGRDVRFVDVGRIGGRDRLLTYAPGRLNWFDPDSSVERPLVAVTADFTPPERREIPHVDVTRDVNGDARTDLVVPARDGFRVFVQQRDGRFAAPVTVGRPPDLRRILGADGYRYDPWSVSRIHEIDYDHDGRTDLVFWNRDRLEVHLQNSRGLFAQASRSFTTHARFDSDDLESLTTGAMSGRVLHTLADLNGDGVGDLVVFVLSGEGTSSKRSSYEVYWGARGPSGGTVFAPVADVTIESPGRIQLAMERQDLDGDGRPELLFTTLDAGRLQSSLWATLKGLMGDDVWLSLEFYRLEDGRYPDAPNAVRRITLDGIPSQREPGWIPMDIALRGGKHERRATQSMWPRAFNMLRLVGDVTGDGYAELFIGKNTPSGLDVFVGVPGAELFARQPRDVPVVIPVDEEYAWLVDMNGDGKQDVVMHEPFVTRDPHGAPLRTDRSERQRVTLLIAK